MNNPSKKSYYNRMSMAFDPTLIDQDLLINDVIELFGSNKKLLPVLAELTKKSEELSESGSRVGTLTAKILKDGELEIRFISRWPLVKR